MKKFSNITESIWSDIQDRSSGEITRKEDDVNLLDRNGFYEYMQEHYGKKIKDINVRLDNYWGEGLNVHTRIKQVNLCIDSFYDKKENITHLRIYPYDEEKTTLADIEPPTLKKRFKVTHSEYLNYADNITEKDDTCTNQTYVDLVELILDHFSLKESVWSDIQDRSSGEAVRKEDDINNLEPKELYEYIKKYYEIIPKYKDQIEFCKKNNSFIGNIESIKVPIFYYPGYPLKLSIFFNYSNQPTQTEITMEYSGYVKDFLKEMEQKFSVTVKEVDRYSHSYDYIIYFTPKGGEDITNRFYLEVLDTIFNYILKHLKHERFSTIILRKKKQEL